MILLLALSCKEPLYIDPRKSKGPSGPCYGATWEADGEPFVLDYCTACHGSALEGDARQGATEGIDLDTPDDVLAHAERVIARVEENTMPPGGGPRAEEVRRFLDWVECDGGGTERDVPAVDPWSSELSAGGSATTPGVDDAFPEGLTVERLLGSNGVPGGTFYEYWLIDGDDAWLVGWEFEEGGTTWDPPLQMAGDLPDSIDTTALMWDADGAWEEDQTWTVTVEESRSDPRIRAGTVQSVTLVEDNTGHVQRIETSPIDGVAGRYLSDDGGSWWFITVAGLFWEGWDREGFAVIEGRFWAELYLYEAG